MTGGPVTGGGHPSWSAPGPWGDPASPAEPDRPYAGPPTTAPPGAGYPPGAYPVHGQYPAVGYPPGPYPPVPHPGGYGYAGPWGPPAPLSPGRPGQVIGAAVLAFVQAGVVLLASVYVYFFASIARMAASDPGSGMSGATAGDLAREGTALAAVQAVSVVLLVVAGIRALAARTHAAWVLLVVAFAVQVVLAVYWTVRVVDLLGDVPGSSGGEGVFAAFSLFFAAAPLVGLGLVLVGAGHRWFRSPAQG